jgi:hypothetical protein
MPRKKEKPLEDAPKGLLLHRHDGFKKVFDGGDAPVCHWCQEPRGPRSRWAHWHEEGKRRSSKLCHSCAAYVFVCMTCAAHDHDSAGSGICCLNPPGPDGVDTAVRDTDRCILGYEQAERFTRKELEGMLRLKGHARLG